MQVLRPLQARQTLSEVASNVGAAYDNLGDYGLSLESHQYALSLRWELGDRAAEALTQNNIGSAYSGLAEYQKALDAYAAALEINRSNDRRWNMAVNLNNIGWVYAKLGDRRRGLIGGSGHVGTYLLPAVVVRGNQVVSVAAEALGQAFVGFCGNRPSQAITPNAGGSRKRCHHR